MDFKDLIKQLGERVEKHKDQILTEEATKNAFVMPFINTLGYDIFNPMEVVPEFVADIGIKKGEKVDYAIMKDGKPIILIECKHWSEKLDPHNSQLFRYFHTTEAKFGILTNGINYRFYTDLVTPNKMDEVPFLDFIIDQIKDIQIERLKEFHKSYFNIESINSTASELKFMNEIRAMISKDLSDPSDEFVRYYAKNIYPSIVSSKILEQFRTLVKRTFNNYINEVIGERLTQAISTTKEKEEVQEVILQESQVSKINTTEEEMEAFLIIRAIMRSKVAFDRVAFRDAQSYFSVLLDDNNRKPICRLFLDGKKKQMSLFDNDQEAKVEFSSISDIYNFSERLLSVIDKYDSKK